MPEAVAASRIPDPGCTPHLEPFEQIDMHTPLAGYLASLEQISKVIRGRFKFQRRVKTLSAAGRLSACEFVLLSSLLAGRLSACESALLSSLLAGSLRV